MSKVRISKVEFIDDGVHELTLEVPGSKEVIVLDATKLGLDDDATEGDFQRAVNIALAALAQFFEDNPIDEGESDAE